MNPVFALSFSLRNYAILISDFFFLLLFVRPVDCCIGYPNGRQSFLFNFFYLLGMWLFFFSPIIRFVRLTSCEYKMIGIILWVCFVSVEIPF